MANEPIVAAPVVAPVNTPAPAPVVAPAAPVVEAAPVVAPVVETPVAPVVEAPKVETVLAEAIDKSKPAPEAPKVEPTVEAKVEPKTEEVKSDEPAPAPVYDPFTVPEGTSLDSERVAEFTKVLSELEQGGKVDHALVQQFGQKMVDTHIAEVKKAVDSVTDLYKQSWERQKTEWKDSFLKDPELGGNRSQTTVDAALTFIRTHGGTAEQQTEFRNLMETSGLGNHPAMIRLLANAGRVMSEGKPLAAQKPVAPQRSKTETMYGKTA